MLTDQNLKLILKQVKVGNLSLEEKDSCLSFVQSILDNFPPFDHCMLTPILSPLEHDLHLREDDANNQLAD